MCYLNARLALYRIFVAKPEGKYHLEGPGTDGMINLETVLTRSKVDGRGLGLSGSGYRSTVASRETRQ